MDKKEYIIQDLEKFKKDLSKKIAIERMIFFGSRSNNKAHKDSDIDLVIVSKDFSNKKFFERSLGFYKYWHLDYPVDFLCYSPQEFKKLSSMTTIVREAVKEGVEI